ncbi:MAG TPA: hypothetical protein VIN02_04020 [Sulfurovum sp.]
MKNLIFTGILTLGLGLTAANAYSAAEALDRHLVAMDYDMEGPGIGEFTEEKYQETKTKKVATAVSEATTLERVLENASRSIRDFEDPYVD